jgi:hypothetical protein
MAAARRRSALGALSLSVLVAASAGAQPSRIDVGPGQVPGDGVSAFPVVSFDGRYTAFASTSDNLVPGDGNGRGDVFRYDRMTGGLTRAPLTPGLDANELLDLVAISHDGRWLLFNSGRSDWVPGDTNHGYDAFLVDFTTGVVERVSVASDGTGANGSSYATSMTPDARFIAFESGATNLGPPAIADTGTDVFVRDRETGTTTQISRGFDGGAANGESRAPRIGPDGAWVSFVSTAGNLIGAGERTVLLRPFLADRTTGSVAPVAADAITGAVSLVGGVDWTGHAVSLTWSVPGAGWMLGVWDRLARRTRLLPIGAVPPEASATAPPRLSLHGRYAAYLRYEPGGWVVRHDDLLSGQSRVLASEAVGEVDMSLDGQAVAYMSMSGVYLVPSMLPPDGRLPWGDADGDGLPNLWEEQFGLSAEAASGDDGPAGDPDHDGASNLAELAAGTHPKALHTRYLAEGVQNAFFDTRLALLNPGPARASVLLRVLRDDATTSSEILVVPPHTRATIRAEALEAVAGRSFAVTVEADVPLAVDRTTIWDRRAYGGTSEAGVAAASTTWYFAEGSTAGRFDLFYLLENPHAAVVDVTVRWMQPAPLAPVVHTYALPPLSRTTLYVDMADVRLVSTDVAAVLEATQPIFAERAMYWSRPGEPFAAGHGASGVVAPATQWYLAEGATGSFFETFLLLLNPAPSPAECTVRYLLTDGSVLARRYALPAESRTTIWADVETIPGFGRALANASFATEVTVDNAVPIVVERAMWWPDGDWREAHATAGATAPAARWAFADGDNVDARTYVLLANTSTTAGDARVTLFFEDGSTVAAIVPVGARQRVTVDTRDHFPVSAGRRFGAAIEALGPTPPALVVERVTYWNADGVFWSGGTGALATPLP